MNDTQIARRSQGLLPPATSRSALLLGFVLVFALLFLSGCAQQPNANLSATACCPARASPYTCHILTDANGKPQTDGQGNILLSGCGATCVALNPSGSPIDSSGNVVAVNQCTDNCNYQSTNCSDTDGHNSCYLLNDSNLQQVNDSGGNPVTVSPVCASLQPDPCVQNDCTAMICGKPRAVVHLGLDANGVQAAANTGTAGNTFSAQANTTQTGLVGRICEFRPLDATTGRLLKTPDWFVNSLRLGISGTFSDYDRARYYMPITDYFCSQANPTAVVDRYTNYLNGSAALSAFGTCPGGNCDYHAPLTACVLDKTSSYYTCTSDPNSLQYSVGATTTSAQVAYEACNQACNVFRLKACTDNPDLLLSNITVSPPSNSVVEQPFVNTNAYLLALQNVYPTPGLNSGCARGTSCDPRDYYKPNILPPPGLDCTGADRNNAACQPYLTNALKPGPAGAKVFECSADSDCLSGTCDQSAYSRTTCFLKDGTSVACGCHVVTDCDRFFACNNYPANSIPATICSANVEACQRQYVSAGTPAIVCDYNTSAPANTYPANAGTCKVTDTNSNAYGGGPKKWGVLDFSEFNEFLQSKYPFIGEGYSNIEMATVQIPVGPGGGGGLGGGGGGVGVKPPQHWADDAGACTAALLGGSLQTSWGASFWAAPNEQTVAGQWGGAYIITSPQVTWQNANCDLSLSGTDSNGNACPNPKFPLIAACNMKPYDPIAKTGDVQLLDPNIPQPGTDLSSGGDFYVGHGPERRVNDTWAIHGFGDCQVDSNGRPVVQSYGVCKPCGTLLTLAYQNVTTWTPPPDVALPADTLANPVSGYCPGGCSTSTYYPGDDNNPPSSYPSGSGPAASTTVCLACNSAYPAASVSPFSQGSPATDPEYGLLVNKIDEYQSAGVMPVLDLIHYPLDTPAPRSLSGFSKEECEGAGGTLGASDCTDPGSNGICTSNTWDCTFPAVNDWLLSFLAKNHSSSVVIAGQLPDDCAILTSSAANPNGDGPHCLQNKSRVDVVNTACPDCLTALEYPMPLPGVLDSATDAAYGTTDPATTPLENALLSYDSARNSAHAKYQPADFTSPWLNPLAPPPADIAAVKILVLDIDLSNLQIPAGCTDPSSSACSPLDAQVNLTLNLSRHVLQTIGWPTLWKLTYKSGLPPNQNPYTQSVLYEALYNRQRELSLAGVVGMLLPPLDELKVDGSSNKPIPPVPPTGLLINPTPIPGSADSYGVRSSPPFCAAQNASGQFLHPQVYAGIQREDAKPFCSCLPCSATDLALGRCGGASKSNRCDDGLSCANSFDSAGNPIGVAADGDPVYCQQHCISQDYCAGGNGIPNHMCDQQPTSTTCTAILSSNLPPTPCCTAGQVVGTNGCQVRPNCDLIPSVALKTLDPNDTQTPELVAGMPAGTECCFQSGADNYTYRSTSSIGLSSEPAVFPGFGSNTSDCGRAPNIDADQQAAVCAGTAPAPIPLSNKLWTCTTPS